MDKDESLSLRLKCLASLLLELVIIPLLFPKERGLSSKNAKGSVEGLACESKLTKHTSRASVDASVKPKIREVIAVTQPKRPKRYTRILSTLERLGKETP
jgi:hypothetical protein